MVKIVAGIDFDAFNEQDLEKVLHFGFDSALKNSVEKKHESRPKYVE
jgi:hypothetical protein